MRITKTIDQVNQLKSSRIKANEGCYVCPNCGNTKIANSFYINSDSDSIIKLTSYVVKESLFKYKSGTIDHYKCRKCGVEWESEIY